MQDDDVTSMLTLRIPFWNVNVPTAKTRAFKILWTSKCTELAHLQWFGSHGGSSCTLQSVTGCLLGSKSQLHQKLGLSQPRLLVGLLILCLIVVKLLIHPTGSEVSFQEIEMSCLYCSLIHFFDLSTRTAISGLWRRRIWPCLISQWFIWPRWKENRAFLAKCVGEDRIRTDMCWLSLILIPVLSKTTTWKLHRTRHGCSNVLVSGPL